MSSRKRLDSTNRVARAPAVAVAIGVAVLATPAVLFSSDDESSLQLAADPARSQVVAACSACHSVDYIVMNSPFQDRAGWEKTVTKMVKVMGAPLTAADATAIVDYLERHYGPVKPSP